MLHRRSGVFQTVIRLDLDRNWVAVSVSREHFGGRPDSHRNLLYPLPWVIHFICSCTSKLNTTSRSTCISELTSVPLGRLHLDTRLSLRKMRLLLIATTMAQRNSGDATNSWAIFNDGILSWRQSLDSLLITSQLAILNGLWQNFELHRTLLLGKSRGTVCLCRITLVNFWL